VGNVVGRLLTNSSASISAALKQSGGKVFGGGGEAELLGMKPATLASRIEAFGLERTQD
jgi:hypothetical protein